MKIFEPLYDLVSWVILTLHRGFDALGMNSSWSWCLAIVGLVVIIRICLIPLFVKQIKSMRNMQMLQPEIKKIQQRYKGDREKTSQELMKLYKEHNTNPLSSCFPILAQAPIFFALYTVLNNISKEPPKPTGVLDQGDVFSASSAHFLSAPISSKFIGADSLSVQIITVVMILAMSASQFYTQRMLMTKNMPAGAMESNPFMQQQKIMLYLFPIMFAVFGINFPIGVLLYWLVSNFWSLGQQVYVIRKMPAVGSPAYEAMMRRKGKSAGNDDGPGGGGGAPVSISKGPKGGGSGSGSTGATATGGSGSGPAKAPRGGPRQQPKSQPRSKRTGGSKKR